LVGLMELASIRACVKGRVLDYFAFNPKTKTDGGPTLLTPLSMRLNFPSLPSVASV
jgi:hypothetical protein